MASDTALAFIYAHLFEDNYDDDMAALGAMARPAAGMDNVIPLRG